MKDLLKFVVCGSVDDGKSTLIGHLLYNCDCIYLDQRDSLIDDNKKLSDDIDYSLLLDGLSAEREQKITIDVAYRFFNTKKRSFIVADTPGHEEYTRNMAVGASFGNLAVILIDATKLMTEQTMRHIRICKMFGIDHFGFIINKMDLVDYDETAFIKVKKQIDTVNKQFNIPNIQIIPVSAKFGENLDKPSDKIPWYKGPSFLEYLETVEINNLEHNDFYMRIQRVCRPNSNFRGYQGQILSGKISVGDTIINLPSNEKSSVKEIYVTDRKKTQAAVGMPVTICLNDEIDISRGDVLVKNNNLIIDDKFTSELLWMDDNDLNTNQNYLIQVGTKSTVIKITNIRYKINLKTGKEEKINDTVNIKKNDIICCDISLNEKIVFDEFKNNKGLGEFILINLITNKTSAAGIIKNQLYENNLSYQKLDITKKIRATNLNQKPITFWFTGLSASGKSTLANELEKYLISIGKHTMLLDGDNIRLGLNKDLKFSLKDRSENIRRIAEISKLLNDAGLIVLTSFISPLEKDRKIAKKIIGSDFVEIYVKTPIKICEERDKKGNYLKARKGIIKDFTGISSPYEEPKNSNIIIQNDKSVDYVVGELIEKIKKYL